MKNENKNVDIYTKPFMNYLTSQNIIDTVCEVGKRDGKRLQMGGNFSRYGNGGG